MSNSELSSLAKRNVTIVLRFSPAGVGRRELSDGGPSVPAGQEEVVVKEEDSARWRNGGNPADKTEARGRAGERGGRPGEKRRRSYREQGGLQPPGTASLRLGGATTALRRPGSPGGLKPRALEVRSEVSWDNVTAGNNTNNRGRNMMRLRDVNLVRSFN